MSILASKKAGDLCSYGWDDCPTIPSTRRAELQQQGMASGDRVMVPGPFPPERAASASDPTTSALLPPRLAAQPRTRVGLPPAPPQSRGLMKRVYEWARPAPETRVEAMLVEKSKRSAKAPDQYVVESTPEKPIAGRLERALARATAQQGADRVGTRWESAPLRPEHHGMDGATGFAHAQGKRPTQEDRHVVAEAMGGQMTIVLDGHGGTRTAQRARELSAECFERCHRALKDKHPEWDEQTLIFNALKLGMVHLNDEIRRSGVTESGSTANAVLRKDDRVYVANLGDSRAVLSTPEVGLQLSADAKLPAIDDRGRVEDTREGRQVLRRGGRIEEHDGVRLVGKRGGIAMPAALGDAEIPGVLHRPAVSAIDASLATAGSYLIQGCDGIFETLTSDMAHAFVQAFVQSYGDRTGRSPSPELIATALVQEAYRRGSGDNLTALVTPLGGELARDERPMADALAPVAVPVAVEAGAAASRAATGCEPRFVAWVATGDAKEAKLAALEAAAREYYTCVAT